MRPYYLSPISSGAAAYFYTYNAQHPSAYIGLAVFFTAVTITLWVRTASTSDCTPECKNARILRGDLW